MRYVNNRGEIVQQRGFDWSHPFSFLKTIIDIITQFFTTLIPIDSSHSQSQSSSSRNSRSSSRGSFGRGNDGHGGNIRGMGSIRPPPAPPGGCAFGSCGM